MMFPLMKQNFEGNMEIKIMHLSESRKEQKKPLFDIERYENLIIVDPITMEIISSKCFCYDFVLNKMEMENCKHLKEDIALLGCYGIKCSLIKSNGEPGVVVGKVAKHKPHPPGENLMEKCANCGEGIGEHLVKNHMEDLMCLNPTIKNQKFKSQDD